MKRLNLCGLERARAQWRPCAIKCHSFGSTSARAGARSGKQTRKKAQPSNSSAARCYLTWHTVLSHLAHGLGLLHIPGHRGCSCCCLQGGSVPAKRPGPAVTEGRDIPRDIPGQGHPRAGTPQGRPIPWQNHPSGYPRAIPQGCPALAQPGSGTEVPRACPSSRFGVCAQSRALTALVPLLSSVPSPRDSSGSSSGTAQAEKEARA